jgi:phage shock protein A
LEERDNAKAEKKDSEKMVEIEIREKNGEIKALKAALRRKNISSDEKQQVNMRLTLLQTFISEQKEHLKTLKENLKLTEDKVSECKKKC